VQNQVSERFSSGEMIVESNPVRLSAHMNKNLNPDRPEKLPEDALAKALEELMEGRANHAEAQRQDQLGGSTSGPEDGCPESGEWARTLCGKPLPAEVEKLLAHAAGCRACATEMRLLTAEASPEEIAELSAMASSSGEWQQDLAAKLARTPRLPAQMLSMRAYLWAGAALAASLLLAILAGAWWQRMNNPERLLAEAYSQSRIFEMRIPGAGFADVTPNRHLRGGALSREPAKLTEARNKIDRKLEASPEDAHWLQLEARADLMEERFDPAIEIFDRLLAAGPVTSSLLEDDAAAYFQRGSLTGSDSDRTTALEYLRRADELAPGDPVVLFNEAVAMEDRETWNRYLRFERDPRWLDDGRHRLQVLEQELIRQKTKTGK
jgi:tetratricopeptide (TPR) repeat protein